MRPIPEAAVAFVAKWEGFRAEAYQDIVGVWTIGHGHTRGVKAGDRVTKAQARLLLIEDLEEARGRLYGVVAEVIADLTDNQWAALLSFVFNLGAKSSWTIWKRLKARQYEQVPGELIKFVNAGGKKVQGLVNRRTDEIRLWSMDEPGSTDQHVPSATTRTIETPPTPADPTPPAKSATLIASAAAAVTAAPPMINQAIQVVQPYAAHSAWVQKGLGTLALIAAVLAVAGLVLMWRNKRAARS